MFTKDLIVKKKWNEYIDWLIDKVARFPQQYKYVLGQRILNIAFDVSESLVVLQFSPKEKRKELLPDFNLKLEKMREFMRIAWRKKIISHRAFVFQECQIDQVGRMMHKLSGGRGLSNER